MELTDPEHGEPVANDKPPVDDNDVVVDFWGRTRVEGFHTHTESSVVELLSDSDDGGENIGRGVGATVATARAGPEACETGPVGGKELVEDQEARRIRQASDDRGEPRPRDEGDGDGGDTNDSDDPLGLDEFDELILSSQPDGDDADMASLPAGSPFSRACCPAPPPERSTPSSGAGDESVAYGNPDALGRGYAERPTPGEPAAPASKEERARARREASANRKRQREDAAAAAKLQREKEREARKEAKERAKEAEKKERAARRELEQQARGNFSHLEVACVMEGCFFEDPRNERARAGAAKQVGCPEEFMVVPRGCGWPGAVWWTRRAHLSGGAAAEGPGVETLDILVVVVHPDTLLRDLEQAGQEECSENDGEAYPRLGHSVDAIRRAVPGFSRLILVLEGIQEELHRRWSTHRRGGRRTDPPPATMDVLEDALAWLLIHKETETRMTKDGEETGLYLWDMTRALSTMPYKDDVTELHCVHRLKTRALGSDSLPKEDQELADAWVRMLQQIPGISELKAVAIASRYPLPRALAAALSDPAVPESTRAVLLADKMGSGRHEGKRARRLLELFSREDGDFVLS